MITVLTPTFNRAATIERLYNSLESTLATNFEWLVIDDGSADDTAKRIRDLQKNASFPVRYQWQTNGGKHMAINAGVEAAKGDWVFIVDSDDAVTPDSLAQIEGAINQDVGSEHVGICFRKELFSGEWVGREQARCPDRPLVMSPTEAGHFFQGDLAYVFRRDVLAELPFPKIEGEKFVPELYIWNQVADRGAILFYPNVSIYRCDYLDDGYSRNFKRNLRRNPRGFRLFYVSQIRRERTWFRKVKVAVRALQCWFYTRAGE